MCALGLRVRKLPKEQGALAEQTVSIGQHGQKMLFISSEELIKDRCKMLTTTKSAKSGRNERKFDELMQKELVSTRLELVRRERFLL